LGIEGFDWMAKRVRVASVGDIPAGQGRAYAVEDRMIAVFFDGENYHAIDDFCPHMGASLSGGYLEGDVVTCPWHAWRFRVTDGTWCDNPRLKVDNFHVEQEGNDLFVVFDP